MSSFEDDNVAVIALWIIAIGFFILAVDKTTRLSKKPEPFPPVPIGKERCPPPNQEDKQWEQIQHQLLQLKDGLDTLKKVCKTGNRNRDWNSVTKLDKLNRMHFAE